MLKKYALGYYNQLKENSRKNFPLNYYGSDINLKVSRNFPLNYYAG
jgi:hypothetical protein